MSHRFHHCVLLLSLLFLATQRAEAQEKKPAPTLAEARKGFKTKLTARPADKDRDPVPDPPRSVFEKIHFKSAVGPLAAYVSPDPKDGKKHPAIIWITGGDCNSIGEVWEDAPADNEQTAAAYRRAGLVMMFPSSRGGNDNPGVKESFLGEVEDVLAAAEDLAKRSYVDPERIYLGGHSTGGTLALLVAETSGRFRATFSFGPVHDVRGYGPDFMPFDHNNRSEIALRSPIYWLESVKSPTFVIEGALKGNVEALTAMEKASKNPQLHFLPIKGATHFNILGSINSVIAKKITEDTGPISKLSLTTAELQQAFDKK